MPQKPGCFAMTFGASRRMSGALEDEHHGDVADDAQGQRHAEALDGGGGEEEQAQRRDHGHEVGVDGGEDGVLHTGDGGRLHRATHADLLAETLHGEDGGVRRHTDGQHDAGDAASDQAEQMEGGKRRQDAEVEHGEHAMAAAVMRPKPL